MNAVELIRSDHENMRQHLSDVQRETTDDAAARKRHFEKIRRAIQRHERIEEEISYPALRDHPKAKELVLESMEKEERQLLPKAEQALDDRELDELGGRMSELKELAATHSA